MTRHATFGPPCPANPENHGAVLPLTGSPRWGWYCPHADHDGRLTSHSSGFAPATRAFFTTIEVESGLVRHTPGTRDDRSVLA